MGSEARPMEILQTLVAKNRVVQHLGMEVVEAREGQAKVAMEVADFMGNSKGACHGGYLFTLADQAAGFACMTRNQQSVSQGAHVTYVSAAQVGERLLADAVELTRSKRSSTCDVRISTPDGRLVALVRCQLVIVGPEILPDGAAG